MLFLSMVMCTTVAAPMSARQDQWEEDHQREKMDLSSPLPHSEKLVEVVVRQGGGGQPGVIEVAVSAAQMTLFVVVCLVLAFLDGFRPAKWIAEGGGVEVPPQWPLFCSLFKLSCASRF